MCAIMIHNVLQLCTYQDCMASNFNDRGDLLRTERITRTADNILELRKRDLVFLHKLSDDFNSQVLVGERLPGRKLFSGNLRQRIWNKETTIMSKSRHHCRSKVKILLTSSSRGVGRGLFTSASVHFSNYRDKVVNRNNNLKLSSICEIVEAEDVSEHQTGLLSHKNAKEAKKTSHRRHV